MQLTKRDHVVGGAAARPSTLEYWRDEGWYVGRLRENPAVMSQAQTLGELQDNIRDALQELLATEEPAPVGRVETIEVQV